MYFDHQKSLFGQNYSQFKIQLESHIISMNTTIEQWKEINKQYMIPFMNTFIKNNQKQFVNKHFPIICCKTNYNSLDILENDSSIKKDNIDFIVESEIRLVNWILKQFAITNRILGCLLLYP